MQCNLRGEVTATSHFNLRNCIIFTETIKELKSIFPQRKELGSYVSAVT